MQQMAYGDFRPVADTAGFIIACPQGAAGSDSARIWNIGQDTVLVDDIGFTEAMIDTISAEYNINQDRVYATGHSMGAFFSIHLAGHLSNKIAAIASVCGSMTQYMYDSSDPVHPTPYMEIHGTADPLVPYNGANPLYLSVPEVIEFWVEYNNCNPTPIVTLLPDIDTTDGSTVEHHVYNGGDNGINVEHFKVIGGGHTWPGTVGGNQDINASVEIWNFLSRYDINGLISGLGIDQTYENQISTPVTMSQNYPNLFNTQTTIRFNLEHSGHVILRIYNTSGQLVQTLVDERKASGEHSLVWNGTDANGRMISPGVYFCRIDTPGGYDTKSMIFLK
jgi:polyhydroxybutyrate depolymerase